MTENDKIVVFSDGIQKMKKTLKLEMRFQKGGYYDPLIYYRRIDIRRLLRAEGFTLAEAIKRSNEIYWAIIRFNEGERYSVSKWKELEIPCGNSADLENLAAVESIFSPDDFADAEAVWEVIALLVPDPDTIEMRHYEKLRGKRMRTDPGVKAANKRARLGVKEERQRQRESEKEDRELLAILKEWLGG
jgi:hypothetical protein